MRRALQRLTLLVFASALAACAHTDVFDSSGHRLLHTEGNAGSFVFRSGAITLSVTGLNHSAATATVGKTVVGFASALGAAAIGVTGHPAGTVATLIRAGETGVPATILATKSGN